MNLVIHSLKKVSLELVLLQSTKWESKLNLLYLQEGQVTYSEELIMMSNLQDNQKYKVDTSTTTSIRVLLVVNIS